MDVVRLRLKGVPISALGKGAVEEVLKRLGYAQLSDMDVLRLMVAGASPAVLARAMGTTPGVVKRRAMQAYKALRGRRASSPAPPPLTPPTPSAPAPAEAGGQTVGSGEAINNEWVRILRSRGLS
ncbi:MAG: hypothetical protein QW680_12300 [Pyrobaculum sp.]